MANTHTKAVPYASWNKHLRPDGKRFTHKRTRLSVKREIKESQDPNPQDEWEDFLDRLFS